VRPVFTEHRLCGVKGEKMSRRILLLFSCLALLVTSCAMGSRRVVTSTRGVRGFDEVILEGLGELTITQGEEETLSIEAESNVMGRITTEVKAGRLYIGWRSGPFGLSVVPTKPIRYDLTMRDIRALDLTGLGSIYAGQIEAHRLDVNMSGGGKVVIRSLSADRLTVELTGLGGCEVSGRTRRQEVLLTGGGDYDAADLESELATLMLTGLGKASVWVTEDLDITITGAGGVEYYGDPRVTQNVSGLGRVRSLGSH
jgi:hypothetical protein